MRKPPVEHLLVCVRYEFRLCLKKRKSRWRQARNFSRDRYLSPGEAVCYPKSKPRTRYFYELASAQFGYVMNLSSATSKPFTLRRLGAKTEQAVICRELRTSVRLQRCRVLKRVRLRFLHQLFVDLKTVADFKVRRPSSRSISSGIPSFGLS